VHHAEAHEWFHGTGRAEWATCPLTQIAFIRISSNPKIIADAVTPREALVSRRRFVKYGASSLAFASIMAKAQGGPPLLGGVESAVTAMSDRDTSRLPPQLESQVA
jgi:hypothetical protein